MKFVAAAVISFCWLVVVGIQIMKKFL